MHTRYFGGGVVVLSRTELIRRRRQIERRIRETLALRRAALPHLPASEQYSTDEPAP
jgi:hypothetical protein